MGTAGLSEEERAIFLNAITKPDPKDVINRLYGTPAHNKYSSFIVVEQKYWHWKAFDGGWQMPYRHPGTGKEVEYSMELMALAVLVEEHLDNDQIL